MKKIISIVLAVCMVFSMTVMAAPVAVSTIETASEVVGADANADASLNDAARENVKPGINIITGTTEPLTGENATDEALGQFTFPGSFKVGANPENSTDKVLQWYIPLGTNTTYPTLTLNLPETLESLVGHNVVHFKYNIRKDANPTENDQYTAATSFWIMHTSGSGNNVVKSVPVTPNAGWMSVDKLLDMLKKEQGSSATESKSVQYIRFQSEVFCIDRKDGSGVVTTKADTVPTDIYLDNMSIVPAYRFNFYTPDGATLLNTIYQAYDESGNIITSYTPKTGLYGNYYVSAWATSIGGTRVETCELNNENVNFYATDYTPAVSVKAEGELGSEGAQMKLVPVVVSALKDTISVSKGTWTVEDDTVASIVTNKNGSATVTALKEGTTKATFTVGNVSATYDISVVFPLDVDVTALATEGVYLDDAKGEDYTAMVITTEGTGNATVSALIGENADSASFEVSGSSDGSLKDNYFDLTNTENWTEGTSIAMISEGDVDIIKEVKLYSSFEPSLKLEIECDKALLSVPGEEVTVSAKATSNLRGVYSEDYTLTVTDENGVASEKVYEDGTALIRARVGTGLVTVTATSTDDPEVSVSKDIYVNVDSDKYGMFFDFLEAETPEDSNIRQCGGDAGNTAASIVDGALHLDRPTTADGNGGIEPTGITISEDAAKKYLVVKTDGNTSWLKFYYKWDSNSHAEANTVYHSTQGSFSYTNEDGTKTFVLPFVNVPDTAEKITGFMGQINKQTSADIHYFYLTSEKPELPDEKLIGHTWEMNSTNFSVSGHHLLSEFDNTAGTVKLTEAYAVVTDGASAVKVAPHSATFDDGTAGYKLEATGSGSLNPKSYPSIKLDDYPYMWIKYKANGSATVNLYLKDVDNDGPTSGYDNKAFTMPATSGDDYVTEVYYLPDCGYDASLDNTLNGMMFAYRGASYISNEIIGTSSTTSSSGKVTNYYHIASPVTYSSSTYAIIDEIVFANYDPTVGEEEKEIPLNLAITLKASADAITTDGGSVTITPNVYANQEIATDALTWTVQSGAVKLTENEDGTVTVTANDNGDAVICATAVEDSSFKATITIKVSGQRAKVASYEFKYYALGNSYLSHGPFTGWPWPDAEKGSRGMAASSYEMDYYHRVQYYLTNADSFKASITSHRGNYAALERAANYDKNAANPIDTVEEAIAAIQANSQFKEIKNYLINEMPNVITVQLSENFSSPASDDITEAFYDTVYGMIDENRPVKSVVVVMTPFQTGTRPAIIKKYAAKYGFYVADMTDVPSYSKTNLDNRYYEKDGVTYDRGETSWKYNPYLAWEQYPEYDTYVKEYYAANGKNPTEFRTHPGDKGMDLIGKRMAEQFEKAVPSYLDAEYIYIPTALTISGEDAVTELCGSISLTAVPAENDASAEVVWSVDDEKIATITQDGVLTAVNNGTVTVTAKSAFNSEIVATKTITVSGQANVYTVTYRAGTTDAVTGLPEADEYARGEYTLSSAVPSRNGYKFLGWALEDGTTVTSVTVDKDTEVYAVWAFAEGWHFDNDGDFEGVEFSGFNTSVANGVGTVVHYGDGVVISDTTLILDSNLYDRFNVRMAVTGSTEEVNTLGVIINTTDGAFTFEADTTSLGDQLLYTFDISEVTGTITGFSVAPSAKDATAIVDWIEFRRVALTEDVEVDTVNAVDSYTVDADGNKYEIETLNIAQGETVTLKNGTFVIGQITGGGAVSTDGNLVYDGELDGYVSADLGEKTAAANLRYAEVDGVQYEIDGNKFGLVLEEGETKLVEIVEKAEADDVVTAATKYYLISADGAREITTLANSVDNVDEVTLRVKDPVGVRFKAGILNTAKADAVVKEYGFVIALERDLINAGADLTLDFEKIATGTAYISGTDTDVINGKNDTTTFFTGVLYGIPENSYGVKLVSKTFMKLDVDGKQYVVYGEPVTASAYQIAKTYENDETLTDEVKAIIDNIITKAEDGKDVGFDYDDLL